MPIALIVSRRGSFASVEIEVEALFDTLFCRETYLQQTWRPKPYQRVHWHHPDDHLVLSGCKRSIVGLHCWRNKIRSVYGWATLFCGYKQARRERCPAQGAARGIIYANSVDLDPTHSYPTFYKSAKHRPPQASGRHGDLALFTRGYLY